MKKKIIIISCILVAIIGVVVVVILKQNPVPYDLRVKSMDYYFVENPIIMNINHPYLYEFTVESYVRSEEKKSIPFKYSSFYNVCITYDFVKDCEMSYNIPVEIWGSPQNQQYYIPRLVVGKSYVMICGEVSEDKDCIFCCYFFKEWEYEGKTYIYPYSNLDTSYFGEGEEFEFVEEWCMYDSYYDYDVVKYFKKNKIKIPNFSHKYEINAFVEKFMKFMSE